MVYISLCPSVNKRVFTEILHTSPQEQGIPTPTVMLLYIILMAMGVVFKRDEKFAYWYQVLAEIFMGYFSRNIIWTRDVNNS